MYDLCVGTFTATAGSGECLVPTEDGVGGEWPGPSGSARLDWLPGTDSKLREGTRIESKLIHHGVVLKFGSVPHPHTTRSGV